MTKKDYEAISEAIKKNYIDLANIQSEADIVVSNIIYDLANIFEKDNPKFDRKRFLTACGLRA